MIEFTLSRVSLLMCGVVLLAAIIIPVTDYYDAKEETDMNRTAESISLMIDSFWDSDADTMILRGWDILPSADCSLSIDEHIVSLNTNKGSYRVPISHPSNQITMSYNDIVEIERNGESLEIAIQ